MKYENFEKALAIKKDIDGYMRLIEETENEPDVRITTKSGWSILTIPQNYQNEYMSMAKLFTNNIRTYWQNRIDTLTTELDAL